MCGMHSFQKNFASCKVSIYTILTGLKKTDCAPWLTKSNQFLSIHSIVNAVISCIIMCKWNLRISSILCIKKDIYQGRRIIYFPHLSQSCFPIPFVSRLYILGKWPLSLITQSSQNMAECEMQIVFLFPLFYFESGKVLEFPNTTQHYYNTESTDANRANY